MVFFHKPTPAFEEGTKLISSREIVLTSSILYVPAQPFAIDNDQCPVWLLASQLHVVEFHFLEDWITVHSSQPLCC